MFARLAPLLISLVVMTGAVAANDLGSRDTVQECIAPKYDLCCKSVIPSSQPGGGLEGINCMPNDTFILGCYFEDGTELCCKKYYEDSKSAYRCDRVEAFEP